MFSLYLMVGGAVFVSVVLFFIYVIICQQYTIMSFVLVQLYSLVLM